MKRIHRLELKIPSHTPALRTIRTEQGQYIELSSRMIYREAGIDRIDIFMVDIALKYLSGYSSHPNVNVSEAHMTRQEFQRLFASGGFLSPVNLLHLKDEGLLYDSNDRPILWIV